MTNTAPLAVGTSYIFRFRAGEAFVGKVTWTDGNEVIFTQTRYQVDGQWFRNRRPVTGVKRSVSKFESIRPVA